MSFYNIITLCSINSRCETKPKNIFEIFQYFRDILFATILYLNKFKEANEYYSYDKLEVLLTYKNNFQENISCNRKI